MYDVIVIGGGQAGLAAGYYLKQKKLSFIILEKGKQAGESWTQRYDSLVLFTPRFYSSLPGYALSGDPNGYASKDEIATYLSQYTEHFKMPIEFNTTVEKITKTETGFEIDAGERQYASKNIIIATGAFHKPHIPSIADELTNVTQLHSSEYRNSSQLKKGNVLVVGAGNSGAQIAVELANEREVHLSVGHNIKFLPLKLLNKSIFWWFRILGILKANTTTKLGKLLQSQPDPIFGFELRQMLKQGKVVLRPRLKQATNHLATFEDHSIMQADNIIWATGFYADYSWIKIKNVVDDNGKPNHNRGVSNVPGLFFIGLQWQFRRGSSLIGGVGEDAEYIINKLIEKS